MGDHRSIWIDGSLHDAAAATVSPFDHGSRWATASSRPCRSCGASRSPPAATSPGCDGRPTGSAAGADRRRRPARRRWRRSSTANEVDQGRLRLTVTGGLGPLGSDRGDRRADGDRRRPPTSPHGAADHRGGRPCRGAATSTARSPASRPRATPRTSSPSTTRTGAAPPRPSSPTPPATSARAPAATCSSSVGGRLLHPAALVGLPGRHHPRAPARAGRRRRGRPSRSRRSADADEAFLTSSTRDVQAIRAVDGRPLAAPGPSRGRPVAFADLMARDLDP